MDEFISASHGDKNRFNLEEPPSLPEQDCVTTGWGTIRCGSSMSSGQESRGSGSVLTGTDTKERLREVADLGRRDSLGSGSMHDGSVASFDSGEAGVLPPGVVPDWMARRAERERRAWVARHEAARRGPDGDPISEPSDPSLPDEEDSSEDSSEEPRPPRPAPPWVGWANQPWWTPEQRAALDSLPPNPHLHLLRRERESSSSPSEEDSGTGSSTTARSRESSVRAGAGDGDDSGPISMDTAESEEPPVETGPQSNLRLNLIRMGRTTACWVARLVLDNSQWLLVQEYINTSR